MSAVVLTRVGPALWARIDRPEAGNACSSEVMDGLEQWLDAAAAPEVRVLVLTGTGRGFCAGADLAEATSLLDAPDELARFLDRGRALVRRLADADVPTIAAVNGAAFGGGLELLLACDIAVATDGARLGDRHIAVGQVPGWGSSAMLPRAVGVTRARRMLITGETWSANQAEAYGLVTEVVGDGLLEDRVTALVEQIAAHDHDAVRRMLGLARPPQDEPAWERERVALTEHLAGQSRPDTLPEALRNGTSADSRS